MLPRQTLLLLLPLACAELPSPEGGCGNGVLEVGEHCEPSDGSLGCGPVGEPAGCRWICSADIECPSDFGCGVDGLCRAPSGEFGEPMLVATYGAMWMSAVDLDGEAPEELALLSSGFAASTLRVLEFDGTRPSAVSGLTLSMTATDRVRPAFVRHEGVAHVALQPPPGPAGLVAELAAYRLTDGNAFGHNYSFHDVPEPEARLIAAGPSENSSNGASTMFLIADDERRRWPGTAVADLRSMQPLAFSLGDLTDDRFERGEPIDFTHPAVYSSEADRVCRSWVGVIGGRPDIFNPCTGFHSDGVPLPEFPVTAPDTIGIRTAVFAELNHDGIDDLVLQSGLREILVSYGVGDGTFHSTESLPAAVGDGLTSPVYDRFPATLLGAHDSNGDGRVDLITNLGMYRACATVTMAGSPVDCPGACQPINVADDWFSCATGPALENAKVIDLDGDGALDLVGTTYDGGQLSLLVDHLDSFTRVDVPLDPAAHVMATGDFDADGYQDIVLAADIGEGQRLDLMPGAGTRGERLTLVDGFDSIDEVVPYRPSAASPERMLVLGTRKDASVQAIFDAGVAFDGRADVATRVPMSTASTGADAFVGRFDPAAPGDPVVATILGTETRLWEAGPGGFFDAIRVAPPQGILQTDATFTTGMNVPLDLDGDDVDELVLLGTKSTGVSGATAFYAERVSDGLRLRLRNNFKPVSEVYAVDPLVVGAAIDRYDYDGDGDDDVFALAEIDDLRAVVLWPNLGTGDLVEDARVVVTTTEAGTWTDLAVVQATPSSAVLVVVDRVHGTARWEIDLESRETVEFEAIDGYPAAQVIERLDVDGDGINDLVLADSESTWWVAGLSHDDADPAG